MQPSDFRRAGSQLAFIRLRQVGRADPDELIPVAECRLSPARKRSQRAFDEVQAERSLVRLATKVETTHSRRSAAKVSTSAWQPA